MCPTAPATVNQGVAIAVGHDPSVSAPTDPMSPSARFSGPASQPPVCISSPDLRPDGPHLAFPPPPSDLIDSICASLRSKSHLRTSIPCSLLFRTRTLLFCACSEPPAYFASQPTVYISPPALRTLITAPAGCAHCDRVVSHSIFPLTHSPRICVLSFCVSVLPRIGKSLGPQYGPRVP
jgi:hypothetical protein